MHANFINKVAIIVPAFNEQDTILAMANSISKYGTLICVDDGSNDKTAQILMENNFLVVSHKNNLGYESALNTGFIEANKLNFDIVITMDADGQHNPSLITSFINKIREGYDVVLGVRTDIPRFSEKLFALYSRIRFNVADPCCGLKAYKMIVFSKKGYFDKYKTVGTELAFFSSHNNFKVSQLPFKVHHRNDLPRYGNKIRANIKILAAILRSIIYNSKIVRNKV